jgi:hypothetical protein
MWGISLHQISPLCKGIYTERLDDGLLRCRGWDGRPFFRPFEQKSRFTPPAGVMVVVRKAGEDGVLLYVIICNKGTDIVHFSGGFTVLAVKKGHHGNLLRFFSSSELQAEGINRKISDF